MFIRITKKCYPQKDAIRFFFLNTQKNAFRENGLVQHTDVEEGKG